MAMAEEGSARPPRIHGKTPAGRSTPDGLTTLFEVFKKHRTTSEQFNYREGYEGTRDETALEEQEDLIADARCLYPNGSVTQTEAENNLNKLALESEEKWHLADERPQWAKSGGLRFRAMMRDVQQAILKQKIKKKSLPTGFDHIGRQKRRPRCRRGVLPPKSRAARSTVARHQRRKKASGRTGTTRRCRLHIASGARYPTRASSSSTASQRRPCGWKRRQERVQPTCHWLFGRMETLGRSRI